MCLELGSGPWTHPDVGSDIMPLAILLQVILDFLVWQEAAQLGVKGEIREHHHLLGKVGSGEKRGQNPADMLLCPSGTRERTRFIPEISVHAAVDQPPIVTPSNAFVITPGATNVFAELKHHRRSKDIEMGQDVPGHAEARRPSSYHCYPQHSPAKNSR